MTTYHVALYARGPKYLEADSPSIRRSRSAEAKRIAEGDPTIAAGHMAIELHPAMLPSLAPVMVKYRA